MASPKGTVVVPRYVVRGNADRCPADSASARQPDNGPTTVVVAFVVVAVGGVAILPSGAEGGPCDCGF